MDDSAVSAMDDGDTTSVIGRLGDEAGLRVEPRQGAKRMLDIALAAAFLIVFSPLLFGLTALLLGLQGRPILFGHKRVGKDGKLFTCYKFRTMVNDSQEALRRHLDADPEARIEWEATQKLKDDPRITPLGRTLRKLSLDELPQFLNVLFGEMSLVGPRPIVPAELRFYGADASAYYAVRPGITGLWQVSGRSNVAYAARVRLDVEYVRDWSLSRDIMILARTVPAVLTSNGSC